jgi:general secretion pathway protein C
VAIIVAEGSPPKALRVGKELAPGITLAEVHPRYVMLSDGGVMKRVDLATDTKPAAAMGGAPGGMPPSGAPPGGMPQQNFPQPQQITTAPAAQPVQAVPEPPMAPGAVQPQPSMTNPGDVGTHDNPPPANPNPINPTPNGQQMPPQTRGDNPAGQMNTQ